MRSLVGLAGSPTDPNRQNRELAIMERMQARHDQKQEQELKAQQIEEETYQKFYEQADKLLHKDRARINNKFMSYQKTLKQAISESGMTKADFLRSGGLTKINSIKNEMLNSEEFSRMKNNRDNAARVLMAMSDPKTRHLVNPNDIETLEAYENSEDGAEITYSGLLADVTIPPSQNFEYGTDIPWEKVASYDGNMLKILANYKMVNPDAPDLDPIKDFKEVQKFMIQMGYGGRGSNTTMAKAKAEQYRRQRDKDKKSKGATYVGELSNIFHEISTGLTPEDIINGNGSYIESLNRDNVKKIIGEKNTLKGRNRSYNMDSDNAVYTPIGLVFEAFGSDKFKDTSRWMESGGMFADHFNLKESNRIFQFDENEISEAMFNQKLENGKLIGFKPDSDFYAANGVKIRTDAKDIKAEDFKVAGIYTAFKMNTDDGTDKDKTVLMVDAYDNDGSLNQESTDALNEGYRGNSNSGNARMTSVIALKNDDGEIIYREIDFEKTPVKQAMSDISKHNEIQETIDKDVLNIRRREYIAQQDQARQEQAERNLKIVESFYENNGHFANEAGEYFEPGSKGQNNRNSLIKSFYLATNMAANDEGVNEEMLQMQLEEGLFTETMSKTEEGFADQLKTYSQGTTSESIIEKWFEKTVKNENLTQEDPDYQTYYNLAIKWKEMLNLINKE